MTSSEEGTDERVGADHSTASFTALTDLASARLGGRALEASDEFFASKSNLLKPTAAVFIPDKFTSRGKWMDGWESRRRRSPGHDWCIIRLGIRGVVHGVNVDTRFFTGNYPSHCSIDAVNAETGAKQGKASQGSSAQWTTLLEPRDLRGDSDNFFAIADRSPWTHLRLNIFPDGGVARFRAYGEAAIDWACVARSQRALDLASILNGGLVVDASDMHFGGRDNIIMPGRAKNMGDGWETRRRRGPGFDWLVVRLGTTGLITRVEIDTNHYKGNFPESASIEACLALGAPKEALAQAHWREILPRTTLRPHHRHYFSKNLEQRGPVSHVRLSIFPDGGISRLRVYGTVAAS
jgi:allantoicase